MSLEAWGDEPWDCETYTEERVNEAFVDGARACREYLARFVEQGGDAQMAASIRANWHPAWGDDPGQVTGELPLDTWGMTQELHERCRANLKRAMGDAYAALRRPS